MEEQERKRKRLIQRKIGKTQNGSFVDLTLLEQLKNMGVAPEIALEGLKQCNNKGNETWDFVFSIEGANKLKDKVYQRAMKDDYGLTINQIIGMNFSEARARAALLLCYNDSNDAIEMITNPSEYHKKHLDRIEGILLPFVQQKELQRKRQLEQELLKKMLLEQQKNKMNTDDNNDNNIMDDIEESNDDDMNDIGNNDENNDIDGDMEMDNKHDDIKEDLNNNINNNEIENEQIKVKPMPNVYKQNNNNNNETNIDDIELVNDFDPVSFNAPTNDDKIATDILDDIGDAVEDPDAYLDLDLTDEANAIVVIRAQIDTYLNNNTNNNESHLKINFNNNNQ